MTGREAVARAVEALAKAEDISGLSPEQARALETVADGWRRLAETLDEHPHLETPPDGRVTLDLNLSPSSEQARAIRKALRIKGTEPGADA